MARQDAPEIPDFDGNQDEEATSCRLTILGSGNYVQCYLIYEFGEDDKTEILISQTLRPPFEESEDLRTKFLELAKATANHLIKVTTGDEPSFITEWDKDFKPTIN